MKILMATSEYDDRILALLEFKKLNVAHSIDFVSTSAELGEYLNSKLNRLGEIPDLSLINSNILTRDGVDPLLMIKSNPEWSSMQVVVFSTFSNLRKVIMWKEGTIPGSRTTDPDELTWVLRRICEGLAGREGWQYHIKPTLRNATYLIR